MRAWRWIAAACLLSGLASTASAGPALGVKPLPYPSSISTGSHTTRILGQLELSSPTGAAPIIGGLSDLAWDEDEQLLYAISDHGYLFHFKPRFDGKTLTGLRLVAAMPLYTLTWHTPVAGIHRDAEGLALRHADNGIRGDSELIVSFERNHRVMRYRPNGTPVQILRLPAPLRERKNYPGKNKSLESVTVSPEFGILTMPEFPLNDTPDFLSLFSLSGRRWLYPASEDTGAVSMQALDDGRLLLLEREWKGFFSGFNLRLSLVRLTRDQHLKPETLLQFGPLDGIANGNYEGLVRHRGNRYFLISDDNYSPFLSTLLLYVELDLPK